MNIRDVEERDSAAIAAIYAHHVVYGTASFDHAAPDVEFHLQKIRRIVAAGGPFLVAEDSSGLIGYAYATQFRDRDGYRLTAEDSLYVRADATGRGVGGALLDVLLERAGQAGFRTVIAVIGGAEPASVAVHATRGFREVGRLRNVGWKHERWLDSVYMQKDLISRG